jgi:hypothetical protein
MSGITTIIPNRYNCGETVEFAVLRILQDAACPGSCFFEFTLYFQLIFGKRGGAVWDRSCKRFTPALAKNEQLAQFPPTCQT